MELILRQLRDQVMSAGAGRPVHIRGGGTKSFYGERAHDTQRANGSVLDATRYAGILGYEPSELVISARAGTLLADVEYALDERGQMLAFEPPRLGAGSTLGGCVAAGLSGPRRMAAGPLRDFVLGATLLGASGTVLAFGGQVMKNVAGYDVSRLLAGSMGVFGMLLDISLKVVPKPLHEATLLFEASEAQALERFGQWRSQPLPVSATAWTPKGPEGRLWVRVSGSAPAVAGARRKLGGELVDEQVAACFWSGLRDQTHAFFSARPLWRVAVPPSTPPLDQGATLVEWNGGQRWLAEVQCGASLRQAVQQMGGHATLYRYDGDPGLAVFHPLPPALLGLNKRLKQALDPAGIFNPQRLFPDF